MTGAFDKKYNSNKGVKIYAEMEMLMINIYICEDEVLQRKRIEEYVKKSIMIEDVDMKLVMSSDNPYDIIANVSNNRNVGLYFLDIDLGLDMTGLQLAQKLRKIDPRCFIVFVTSHSEMSFLTFQYRVEAMDFIIKDDYDKIYSRIHECILNVHERYSSINNTVQKNFAIKTSDKCVVVSYHDILFFETSMNIHKIILHAKSRQIEFYGKLKDIEGQLDDDFYRCHRSYIVNKRLIREVNYQSGIIHMINGQTCLVSTRLLKGLRLI